VVDLNSRLVWLQGLTGFTLKLWQMHPLRNLMSGSSSWMLDSISRSPGRWN